MGWTHYFSKELVLGLILGFFLSSLKSDFYPPPSSPERSCVSSQIGTLSKETSPILAAAAQNVSCPRRTWVGSMSPLLMHLRCSVESYGSPNVLVANGLTGLVVVDVGMNNGEDFTIPAAVSGHKVYAFEPVRRKFAHVQKELGAVGATFDEYDPTIAIKDASFTAPTTSSTTVTMVWAAVGDTPGFVSMKEHPEDGSMDHVQPGAGGNVPIVPLSAVIPLESRIYLLKVDTEGHDGLAIKGAEPWLQRGAVDFVYFEMNPLLMERTGQTAEATLTYLAAFGYSCMEASLSSKLQPYLLKTTTGSEYMRKRLPHFDKPFYAGSCFTNVL